MRHVNSAANPKSGERRLWLLLLLQLPFFLFFFLLLLLRCLHCTLRWRKYTTIYFFDCSAACFAPLLLLARLCCRIGFKIVEGFLFLFFNTFCGACRSAKNANQGKRAERGEGEARASREGRESSKGRSAGKTHS